MAAALARTIVGVAGDPDASVPVSGTAVINGTTYNYNCVVGGTSAFVDVDPGTDTFCRHIHYIAKAQIANGCQASPLEYCENGSATESAMLKVLQRMANVPNLVPPLPPPVRSFFASYHPVPRGTIYTYRDESNRVVTEASDMATGPTGGTLSTTRDNVYLGNLLVASYVSNSLGGPTGWAFYHSDHLGTPRLITSSTGGVLEMRKYWPYGDEVSTNPLTSQRLRFATMERDLENNHYYDHARSHDWSLGRFIGVDKVGGNLRNPQTWNRYIYSGNNPLKFLDPNGAWVVGATQYHDQIARAYANSPTFRRVYDAQNHNPNVIQRLRPGLMTGSTNGITIGTSFLPQRGPGGELLYGSSGSLLMSGTASLTTLPAGSGAATIGHELQHGFELFTYGDISLAPTARPNTSSNIQNTWETQTAQDVEKEILDEINAPGADKTLTPAQEKDVFGPSEQYENNLPFKAAPTPSERSLMNENKSSSDCGTSSGAPTPCSP